MFFIAILSCRLKACKYLTDLAVGWANGSIVNPTWMPSNVGCEKYAAQATHLTRDKTIMQMLQ